MNLIYLIVLVGIFQSQAEATCILVNVVKLRSYQGGIHKMFVRIENWGGGGRP